MTFPDLSSLTKDDRLAMANKIKTYTDFTLPELTYFNSAPCSRHATLEAGKLEFCQECGVELMAHQRVGVAWLYMKSHSLLAFETGLGKMICLAALLAVLKQREEIGLDKRVLFVTKAGAVPQCQRQLKRMLPKLDVIIGMGTLEKRVDAYLTNWEVCVISYQTLIRDYDRFFNFNIDVMICDDVDPLRTRSAKSSHAVKTLAKNCSRVVQSHATPWQKRLPELYSAFELIGGREIFGTEPTFKRRFIRTAFVYDRLTGRKTEQIQGYTHMTQLRELIDPHVLRKTAADLDGSVDMPSLVHNEVVLDLHPQQRKTYEQLKRGALAILKAGGTSYPKANAAFTYALQICLGLGVLPEGVDEWGISSTKLDWIMQFVRATDEKVVVFLPFRRGVTNLTKRLEAEDIGSGIIWGAQPNKLKRQETQDRFWYDPNCRVLMGTSALESSLNLQVSRHLISAGLIINPARVQQLGGRIKRINSVYKTVYFHSLLTESTVESNIMDKLKREQAMTDYIWHENNEIFNALSPLEMLELITG